MLCVEQIAPNVWEVVGSFGQVANCSAVIVPAAFASPWQVSVADAQALAVAIASVWALAWLFRVVTRFVRES